MSHPIQTDKRTVTINLRCQRCAVPVTMQVIESDFWDWRQGKLIQEAMPYLNAGEREMLISRTCDACFNEMFGDE